MQVEQLPTDSRIAREQSGPVGPTRYDLVLAVIGLALAASGVASATTVPWPSALAAGGVVALAATTYGLFVDPPTSDREPEGTSDGTCSDSGRAVLPNDPERSLTTAITRQVSRFDAILLSIPLVLLAAGSLVAVPTVSLLESVAFGASASLVVMGYALFAGAPKN